MLAIVAVVLFVIAAVKDGKASDALFWCFIGLAVLSAYFALDPWLGPYYPRRR